MPVPFPALDRPFDPFSPVSQHVPEENAAEARSLFILSFDTVEDGTAVEG